jgi:hypothetical protein
VRALGGKFKDFTCPYWDWTKDAFPSGFTAANDFMGPDGDAGTDYVSAGAFRKGAWKTFLTGPTSGTLDLERRFNNISVLTDKGPGSFLDALSKGNFSDMTAIIEGRRAADPGMHNDAHARVGGQLSDPTSGGDDPVFFLLHSFTDLMWTKWQVDKGQLGKYDPAGDVTAQLGGFGGPDDNGFKGTTGNQIKDVLSPFQCDYTYQYNGRILGTPEPSPIVAFGIGAAGLLIRRRRRSAV